MNVDILIGRRVFGNMAGPGGTGELGTVVGARKTRAGVVLLVLPRLEEPGQRLKEYSLVDVGFDRAEIQRVLGRIF